MSSDRRHYDVTRGHQTIGEDVVTIRPTLRTAHDWARALLGELSKDVALTARLAAAAAAIADGTPTGAAREATTARLQVALLRAARVELYVDEVDILADDIHDAMVPLPPCETDGCNQPEHYTGLCWDHLTAREVAVQDKVAAAIASAPALCEKADRVLGGAS